MEQRILRGTLSGGQVQGLVRQRRFVEPLLQLLFFAAVDMAHKFNCQASVL